MQHRFNEHWNAYAAFRTDLTSIPTGVRSVGTLVNWNLYHANVGVQASLGRASVILGLDTAWGSEDGVNAIGAPAPGAAGPADGERIVPEHHRRARLQTHVLES